MADPGGEASEGLPIPPTLIVGRERELSAAETLLVRGPVRLLTLTGPAGVGKSRLALEVARHLSSRFRDGAYFVPMAAIRDPELVPVAILNAIGLPQRMDQTPLESLKAHLPPLEALLLLDNFEQVVAAAPLIAELLAVCQGPRILVTSRVLLGVSAEYQLPVDPLAFPHPFHRLSPAEAMEFPAIRLFVSRAEAATGQFAIDDNNAAATIGICARLEGMPLALELAAARIRHLPLTALLAKLDHRLPLSAGGARDVPARHRTLRDAIAWSHDLLDPAQRTLFRRLSVFASGWTLDATQFVSNAIEPIEQDVFDLHSSLVDASLIRQSLGPTAGNHTEARFEMLETIREYGLEQLADSREQDVVRQAHAAYYLSLAEQARRDLIGPAHGTWIARLADDHDNLHTAIASAISREDADSALRLGSALWQYWAERGHLSEGRAWLEQALAINQDVMPSVRGDAFHVLGNLSLDLNDYERATTWFEEGLRIWRLLGDDDGAAVELTGLGIVARHRGNYDLAKTYFLECLAIFRGKGAPVKVAATLHNLGDLSIAEGDLDQARMLHEEALGLRRALGDKGGIAYSLLELAMVDQGLGDHASAAARLEKSLALFLEVGNKQGEAIARDGLGRSALRQGDDRAGTSQLLASIGLRQDIGDHFGIAECLEALAEVASRRGDAIRAARLLGASAVIFDAVGQVQPTADRVARDRLQAIARQSLGREAFNRAYNAGRELSLESAVADAMTLGADVESTPHEALRFGLSAREVEVLRLLTQRMTDPEIAGALFISPRTASSHVASILRKVGVENRREAAAFAVRIGLTVP